MKKPKVTYALLSSLDPITEVTAPGYRPIDATGKEPPFTIEIEGFDSDVEGFVVFVDSEPVKISRLALRHRVHLGDKLLLNIGEP